MTKMFVTYCMMFMLLLLSQGVSATQPTQPMGAAGLTWEFLESGTNADFRGICAVSSSVAWASGSEGTVLRTTDGGKQWKVLKVPGAGKLEFRDIQAFDEWNALILSAGSPAKIFRTIDGGLTWALVYTNSHKDVFFDSMAFWDRRRGIVFSDPVDGMFLILTTDDGGATWFVVPVGGIPSPWKGEAGFAASGTMLAVQGKGNAWFGTGGVVTRVFRSRDGGKQWKVSPAPVRCGSPPEGIFSVAFYDEMNGVVVGGNYRIVGENEKSAAYTVDGGKTWVLAEVMPSGFRECVVYVPGYGGKFLVTVGPSGCDVSGDGGRSWRNFSGKGFHSFSIEPGGRVGWAVGAKGRVARLKLPSF